MNKIPIFDRAAKLALIKRMIEARLSGDAGRFANCFTEEVVFSLSGCPLLMPYFGRRVGRENMMDAIRFFDVALKQYDNVIDTPVIDGGQAALRFRMTIQSRCGGAPAPTRCVAHLKFENWLASELTVFIDSALVLNLVRRQYGQQLQ